jgi:glutamyl-tRNA(Gln) amidotransferase subunit E
VTEETFLAQDRDVTDLLDKSSFAPLRAALTRGHRVRCVRLAGFAGVFNAPTQEHTTFAKEFADRVRVIACLTELPNMVHSDLAAESMWPQDWQKLRRRMHAGDQDVLVVVWGPEVDTRTACQEIAIRGREATIGVPSDTRQALKDDTNGFERVLPGPERMYPDTDLPPIALRSERIETARSRLPEFVWETETRFREGGMVPHDVARLIVSPWAAVATRAVQEMGLSARWLGVLLAQRMTAFKRAGLRPERFNDGHLWAILEAHAGGRLAREGVPWLLERLLRECEDGIADAQLIGALASVRPATDEELDRRVDEAIDAARRRTFKTEQALARHVMGALMADLIGRVDGRRLAALVETRVTGRQRVAVVETLERKRSKV